MADCEKALEVQLTEGSETFPPPELPVLTDPPSDTRHSTTSSFFLSPRCLRLTRYLAAILAHGGVVVFSLLGYWRWWEGDVVSAASLGVAGALSYLMVLVEAAHCDTRAFLRCPRPHRRHRNGRRRSSAGAGGMPADAGSMSAEAYVERVRDARPMVRWLGMCYHYDDDYTSTLVSKRQQASNEYVPTPSLALPRRRGARVMSCKDMEAFRFTRWKDRTEVSLPRTPTILRIHSAKEFHFRDERARQEYEQQHTAFMEQSRRKDEFMTHQEELLVPAFQERVLACCGGVQRPCWMREEVFWLSSALLLTAPYRALFYRLTHRIHISFVKELEA